MMGLTWSLLLHGSAYRNGRDDKADRRYRSTVLLIKMAVMIRLTRRYRSSVLLTETGRDDRLTWSLPLHGSGSLLTGRCFGCGFAALRLGVSVVSGFRRIYYHRRLRGTVTTQRPVY